MPGNFTGGDIEDRVVRRLYREPANHAWKSGSGREDGKTFGIPLILQEDSFVEYFGTFLDIFDIMRKTKNKNNRFSTNFDEVQFYQKDKSLTPDESCKTNDSFTRILNLINKHKDQRIKIIFHERYFCGKRGKLKPWKDVAKKINLSPQGCINIHDKAIKELSHKIDNEKIKF